MFRAADTQGYPDKRWATWDLVPREQVRRSSNP